MRYSGPRWRWATMRNQPVPGPCWCSAWLLLAFTHEGALVLLLAIGATLVPRGLWSATFVRAAVSLTIILILAAAAKIVLPPDDYYTDAFLRAALHFFDLEIFKVEVVVVLLAAVVVYGPS